MLCPKCEVVELTMADRQGVEIDYCRACRGVWLDRDELDKIIERSMQFGAAPVAPSSRPDEPKRDRDERHLPREDYRSYRGDDDDDDRRKKGKKRGFLGDIFDVFDD